MMNNADQKYFFDNGEVYGNFDFWYNEATRNRVMQREARNRRREIERNRFLEALTYAMYWFGIGVGLFASTALIIFGAMQ